MVRTRRHPTGLHVVATHDGGRQGTAMLTPTTGHVVLSAGAFGTPELLFRSGIGPADQSQVVQAEESAMMIKQSDWINLPVGRNLNGHFNTDIVVSHPIVSYYDRPAAWLTPILQDQQMYLQNRSGPLAQAALNIGSIFWEEIMGPDGIARHMQWQERVGSS